ncbi:hypothetical protein C8_293 [Cannes 8 virus]|uniref:Uncharacterized protein n=1 Tax=Marseillevirus marseillevirus TaxID=694581 RepID=D2XAS7_GBMV|nr:hypothetical protein MAR_ORF280 [Marseillevirus marseillevirus]YP_009094752.1 hypothetical protein MEL_251 [Melbournevirus]AGV01642.1 hypothetical protein C8_293 [Cannes 8 virus]AVR52996.1 hypothetical protein MarSH_291 [Marseillevirus Shanghai 1]ADB04054.1 hypothetical protein MAR_ORF280 [Marseillevirus marseillevirus]AIT54864.1 hypothetical protein MEL_251 [Melbournevirus]
MTRWFGNAKVYEEWLDLPEGDIEHLKDKLCTQQFGYLVSKRKIVWVPLPETSYPLIITPEITKKELESFLPKIISSRWFKHPQVFVENWKGYDKTRDGAKLDFSVDSGCCFQ